MNEDNIKLEDLLGKTKLASKAELINVVAVIGGGVMGQGIAQTVAAAGIETILIEKDQTRLERSRSNLSESMEREINRWTLTKSEKKSILARIRWEIDLAKVNSCELVIEAVDEDFELKRDIFKRLDAIAKKDTIYISSASTLSITKIAETTDRPDKIIGMHFLNPIAKKFASRIGKTPVEVYEYPGFITTRAIVPLLNEAMYILMEGVATAKDIDTAMKLGYNFPNGPLEMADIMGLDEVLTWMETLWKTLGEPRYRACPILRKLVRERKLGKKTGEGFYKYDENGKIIYQ